MERKSEIVKILTQKITPIVASALSVIVLSKFLIEYDKGTKYFEILLTTIAAIGGVAIAFSALKILYQKRDGYIFISYTHKDKKFVERLVQNLKAKRFNILYDEDIIRIGDNIHETIIDNIKKSSVVILVLSKNMNTDKFLDYELKTALENNKKILPIIIENDVEIPSVLRELKYADFTKEYYDSLRKLFRALVITLEEKNYSQKELVKKNI